MKFKKVMERILLLGVMVFIMAGGALGIYKIKNEYSVGNIEGMLSKNISATGNEVKEVEKIETTTSTVKIIPEPQANAGGEIVTSELSSQEQGYEEYLKEWESSLIDESTLYEATVKETTVQQLQTTQSETTKPRETTSNQETTKKQEQETSKKVSIADIFRSMGYNDEAMGGEEVETTSIDINSVTLPYELPFELPKPMG